MEKAETTAETFIARTEEKINEQKKTISDWMKDNEENFTKTLTDTINIMDSRDFKENGRVLLHIFKVNRPSDSVSPHSHIYSNPFMGVTDYDPEWMFNKVKESFSKSDYNLIFEWQSNTSFRKIHIYLYVEKFDREKIIREAKKKTLWKKFKQKWKDFWNIEIIIT